MNIIIISPEFPPKTNWGGIATFNKNLAKLLSSLDNKVHVITFDGEGANEILDHQDNISIHYVRFKTNYKLINFLYYRFPFGVIRFAMKKYLPSLLFAFDWNIFALFLFRKLHKKYSFKLIFSPTYHIPSLLISSIYSNIPTVLHVQGPQEELNQFERVNLDTKIKSWLENQYMIKFSKKIVACSKYLHKKISKRIPQIRHKFVYIHNFIDTKEYLNSQKQDINNLVFLGRLEYRKGVDLLIEAFVKLTKKNKELKLWLIGEEGGYFPVGGKLLSFNDWFNLLKIKDEIKNNIYFFNRIDHRNLLIKLLTMLKGIAVFPSRYEPFGFVNIEAMAIGYIAISSYRGAATEIINDKVDGFIIYPNLKSVYSTIKKILDFSELEINRISNEAKLKVKSKFDILKVKKDFSKIINEVIKK